LKTYVNVILGGAHSGDSDFDFNKTFYLIIFFF